MFVPGSDMTAAEWILTADRHWWDLVTLGPPGLPAYARLRFIPDPAYEGQSEHEGARQSGILSNSDALSDSDQLRIAVGALSRQGGSPTEGYLLIWDGWGEDLFPESVLQTPRVPILDGELSPPRGYYMLQLPLQDFVSGAVESSWHTSKGLPMPTPGFIWPADRAWCITSDIDPHWAGIGADPALIRSLLNEPRLDVVRVEADQELPFYFYKPRVDEHQLPAPAAGSLTERSYE